MNMHTSAGGVALDIAVTCLLWVAALLQVALLRDDSLPESRLADAARWLVAAGLTGLAMRFTFVLFDTGDILVPPYSMVPLMLLAIGNIALAVDRLRRPRFKRRVSDIPPSQWPHIMGAGRK